MKEIRINLFDALKRIESYGIDSCEDDYCEIQRGKIEIEDTIVADLDVLYNFIEENKEMLQEKNYLLKYRECGCEPKSVIKI